MSITLDNSASLLPLEHHKSFFKLCFATITKHPDSQQFTQWMLQTGARLMPQLVSQLPPGIGNAEQYFRVLAKKIWESTPLPHLNFNSETLPPSTPSTPSTPSAPSAPCFCGSGQAFQQCCFDIPNLATRMPEINMLPFVIDSLSRQQWITLAHSGISIPALTQYASRMLQEHREQQVVSLLAPWFPYTLLAPPKWPEDRYPLVQILLHAYHALGQHQPEEHLASIATLHSARAMRGAGWLQLAILLTNQIRLGEAWDALHHAEEFAPDHPDLAQIEVILLIRQANWEQASRRGHFWALRFHRLHGESMAHVIETLNKMASNPKEVFAQTKIDYSQLLAQLILLVQHAPPPECAYQFVPQLESSGKLEPGVQLQEALDEWYQKYTFLPQQAALEGVPYDLAWKMAADWMPLLGSHPILWHSFEVLDDLTRMIAHGHPQQSKATNLPLVERSAALFDTVVLHLKGPEVHLDWDMVENRPAMHLAIQHLDNLIDRGKPEPIIQWLEKILFSFHRSDEQHWREILMPFYLEAGRYKEAIDLARRYPDDIINMRYDHALALFMDGQKDAANEVLANALALYPMIAMTLLTRFTTDISRKMDADDEPDLASAYFDTHIGVWPTPALDWLKIRFPLSMLDIDH